MSLSLKIPVHGALSLVVLLWVAACSSNNDSRPTLEALPSLDFSSLEAPVQSQLESAINRWQKMAGDRSTPLPTLARAAGEVARLLHSYNQHHQAEAAYRNARALDPANHEWAYLHGSLLQDAGRLDDAIEPLTEAVATSPADVPSRLRLARSLLGEQRFDEAKKQLQDAIALDSESALAFFLAGKLELAHGDPRAAVLAFGRALELQPEASDVQRAVAAAFNQIGDPERAQAALALAGDTRVRQSDPIYEALDELAVSAEAHLRRAQRARLEGDAATALDEHLQAVAAAPQNAEARAALGTMFAQIGELDDALKELRNAQRLGGPTPRVLANLAGVHRLRGEAAAAVPVYERLLNLDPGNLKARLGLARAHREAGQKDRAIEAYRSVMKMAPTHPQATAELQKLLVPRSGSKGKQPT